MSKRQQKMIKRLQGHLDCLESLQIKTQAAIQSDLLTLEIRLEEQNVRIMELTNENKDLEISEVLLTGVPHDSH